VVTARKEEMQNVIAPEPSQVDSRIPAHCSRECAPILERRESCSTRSTAGRVEVATGRDHRPAREAFSLRRDLTSSEALWLGVSRSKCSRCALFAGSRL
jgi:hypothetical protein